MKPKRRVPKKRGPKPLRATPRQLRTIERLSALKAPDTVIYAELNISAPTFIKWKKEDPRVLRAIGRGHSRLYQSVIGKLHSKVQKGDTIAAIFLSKALLGVRENEPTQDSKPQIVIALPGAAKLTEYAGPRNRIPQTIDAEPEKSE